jgi:hypothetical protein
VTDNLLVIPVRSGAKILESSCGALFEDSVLDASVGHWHDRRESVIAVQAEGAILDGPTIRSSCEDNLLVIPVRSGAKILESRYEDNIEDTALDESVGARE